MSIRGGRGPRDQARPFAEGEREASIPTWRAADGRRMRDRRPRPSRRGVPGFLKFLAFTLVLAALVLVVLFTTLRPVVRAWIVGWAWDTPSSFNLPFVADLIREDLDGRLTEKGSAGSSERIFTVRVGDTPETLATRLHDAGLVADTKAFRFAAFETKLASKLKAGDYIIRGDMSPEQLAVAVVSSPLVVTSIQVTFREGLRLEQLTAKLQTVASDVDPKAFYDLVKSPPASLLADYPWLSGLPAGASLEGFLYPATYTLVTGSNAGMVKPTSAEGLARMMLNAFHDRVGDARLDVPKDRGLSFYQVLVLASVVEREALLDSERPLIAGVYQNRLNPKLFPRLTLESDPTIIYLNDTLKLAKLPFDQWQNYLFWAPINGNLPADLPKDLAGYDTYHAKGLPPGPLCSPTVASIDAALHPDTSTGYLYFIAKGDGSGTSAFATTYADHLKNVAKYGH